MIYIALSIKKMFFYNVNYFGIASV